MLLSWREMTILSRNFSIVFLENTGCKDLQGEAVNDSHDSILVCQWWLGSSLRRPVQNTSIKHYHFEGPSSACSTFPGWSDVKLAIVALLESQPYSTTILRLQQAIQNRCTFPNSCYSMFAWNIVTMLLRLITCRSIHPHFSTSPPISSANL